jgi:ribosomal protein S12 methylthiotransferase accessory factor
VSPAPNTSDDASDSASDGASVLERVRLAGRRCGVTRVADVTWLDSIGVPVFQAVRPASRSYVVSQGKGTTEAQAEISATMESLEQYAAERVIESRRASFGEMRAELDYDAALLSRISPRLDDRWIVPWVAARDIATGRRAWVPFEVVSTDYRRTHEIAIPIFRRTTNGLGGGASFASAVLHALYEAIERDALSRASSVPVALEGFGGEVDALRERIERAGLALALDWLPNDTELPCFVATIDDRETLVRAVGSACRASRSRAAVAAILEAIQGRSTAIQASRDDIDPRVYHHLTLPAVPLARTEPEVSPESIEDRACSPAEREVRWLVQRLGEMRGIAPIVTDLSRPEIDLPVVHVLCPGLSFEVRHA